jgi:DNA-binding MarR family transcriptional regulator
LANQINERLNAKRRKLRINTTQMLILAALPPMEGRTSAQAVTINELAAQLQLGRKTVSAQLKGMAEDGLVEVTEPTANVDRRCKRHRMTRAGQAKALHVWQVLGALDSVFRALLGDKLTRSHPQAIRLLVDGLPTAPPLDNARKVDRFCEQMSRKRREETVARKTKGK